MQVENHKEEVPFGHYEKLFCQADPKEIAERLGVDWDGREFKVTLLGRKYAIRHPEYGIREMTDSSTTGRRGRRPLHAQNDRWGTDSSPAAQNDRGGLTLSTQTFLLRYLLEAKKVAAKGSWLTFREMPWGELYIKPYTGRVLTRAAFTFGTRIAKFKAAAEKMGGVPVNHGDAGFQFQLVEGYHMQILIWEGDEEFPPSAQVLYSDNFADGFAPEDRVVAGDILISAIKENM